MDRGRACPFQYGQRAGHAVRQFQLVGERTGCSGNRPVQRPFVQDVGAAFLAAGLALAARAWRPSYWPAAMAGAAFMVAHALIHLVMIAGGHDHHTAADLALVIGPAALAVYSAFPNHGEQRHA